MTWIYWLVGALYWGLTWGLLALGAARARGYDDEPFWRGFFGGPLGVAAVYARKPRAAAAQQPAFDRPSRGGIGEDPEPLQRFLNQPVNRPSDVDRAGPYVPGRAAIDRASPPAPSGQPSDAEETRRRWAEQMREAADAELEQRRRGPS